MARQEYGWAARWLDGKSWVMGGILFASFGALAGAYFVWDESKLGSIVLVAVGLAGGSLVWRGRIRG